jgi:hypothetical protein
LTHADLGELIAASRPRVSEAMVFFKERGLIRESRDHYITLLDEVALQRYYR